MRRSGEGAGAGRDGIVVSVVIPARNEEQTITRCLASLARQGLPPESFEVIVVDNGSRDRTAELARSFPAPFAVTVLQRPAGHISAVRNAGAAAARGELLAFLDADCVAPPHWLVEAIERLRADEGMVIGGYYSVPPESSWVAQCWYGDRHRLKQGPVSYLPSSNLIMTRALFFTVGGFDEGIETSEDCEFCHSAWRAGFRVVAIPSLTVVHLRNPERLWDFFRKQLWHGTNANTSLLRQILAAPGSGSLLLAVYMLLCLVVVAAGLAGVMAGRNSNLLLAGAAGLLLPPVALGVRAAGQRRRWSSLPALAILYLLYGAARAASLLTLKGYFGAMAVRASIPGRSPAMRRDLVRID